MSYFSNFPRLNYKDDNGVVRQMVDILKRVSIGEKMKNNSAAFRLVRNPSSAKPDVVAYNRYGDSKLFWIPFFMNDVVDPMYDWVLDDTTFEEYLSIKYPGSTFFVDYTDKRDLSSSSSSSQSSASTEQSVTSSSEALLTSSSSSPTESESSPSSASTGSSQSSSSSSESNSSSSSLSTSSSLSSSSTEAAATSGSSLSSSSTDNSYSSQTSSGSTGVSVSSSSSNSSSQTDSNSQSSSSSSSQEIANFLVGETVTFSDGRTGVVHTWEPTYRRLIVTGISTPDTVVDLVDTFVSGGTTGASAYIRRAFPESKFALHHFEGTITDGQGNTLFEKVVLNPFDYIEGFVNSAQTDYAVSNFEYEHELNEAKRNLFLPDTEFAEEFKRSLRNILS